MPSCRYRATGPRLEGKPMHMPVLSLRIFFCAGVGPKRAQRQEKSNKMAWVPDVLVEFSGFLSISGRRARLEGKPVHMPILCHRIFFCAEVGPKRAQTQEKRNKIASVPDILIDFSGLLSVSGRRARIEGKLLQMPILFHRIFSAPKLAQKGPKPQKNTVKSHEFLTF